MYTVFTNNNAVAEFFKQKPELNCTVKWVNAPAMEVLVAARVNIRKGAALISNPLVGINLPVVQAPGRNLRSPAPKQTIVNPYLTVLTTMPNDTVDFQSVKQVDEALSLYKKNAKLRFVAHSDDAVQHFQMVDIKCMLQRLSELLKIEFGLFQ
ncbi:MAG: hypothetical protein FWB88_00380 [Defluviitaleaceae bacterium]|nr:hypothetical protein [Defluviitaleaceae bacterium]MCL2239017.1 hypothetical protein [Defluviitaleaceae bacterium]